MKLILKKIIQRFFLILGYEIQLINIKKRDKDNSGKPSSSIEKQSLVMNLAKSHQIDCLVETGTYLGAMVYATKDYFKKIITIELSEELVTNAIQKFEKYPYIKVLHGDSGKILPKILPELTTATVFWLDGHFSQGITAKGEKDAPVSEELQAIEKSITGGLNHLVLIDDARLFIHQGDHTGYPPIAEIERWVQTKLKGYTCRVQEDVIIIAP